MKRINMNTNDGWIPFRCFSYCACSTTVSLLWLPETFKHSRAIRKEQLLLFPSKCSLNKVLRGSLTFAHRRLFMSPKDLYHFQVFKLFIFCLREPNLTVQQSADVRHFVARKLLYNCWMIKSIFSPPFEARGSRNSKTKDSHFTSKWHVCCGRGLWVKSGISRMCSLDRSTTSLKTFYFELHESSLLAVLCLSFSIASDKMA